MFTMKYKIVGIINLVFGIPQLFISLILPSIVIPRLITEFNSLNLTYQSNPTINYFVSASIFIEAMINIYLGMKAFKQAVGKPNKEKDRYFRYSIISAVVTILSTGVLIVILV